MRHDLFGTEREGFDAAILNPRYKKLSRQSDARLRLREVGIETSNLYTGFLALVVGPALYVHCLPHAHIRRHLRNVTVSQ